MKSPESPEARAVSQIRTRAILFLIIAVAAGAGAVMLVKNYLEGVQHAAAASAPRTKPVVVAAMDIPIAVRLEDKHLAVIRWPEQSVPEGAFGDIKSVLDKTTRQNLIKGEAILSDRLADEDLGQGL